MRAVLVTAPTKEPITLAEAKAHLRVDTSDDDQYIESLITAARVHAEHVTGRALLTQTWDYVLDGWPSCDAFTLPFGNLASVTSVTWKDDDGTAATLAVTTDYLVETNGEQCGRIVLPYGKVWPTGTLYPSNPITVRYVCGWTSPANIPGNILAALKLYIAKLYESRGEDVVGTIVAETGGKAAMMLLQSSRLWDEF